MSSNSSYLVLLDYLLEHDFLPQSEGEWFDRRDGARIVRVVCDAEEEAQLIALTPRGVCLYKAMFTMGTPNAVIIAAIDTALAQPEPQGRPR